MIKPFHQKPHSLKWKLFMTSKLWHKEGYERKIITTTSELPSVSIGDLSTVGVREDDSEHEKNTRRKNYDWLIGV